MIPKPELNVIHLRMKAATGVARLPLRAGALSGVSGSILGQGTGSSIDFEDQRPYLPGDDPRHINWQAYARTGSYTMKLYRQEVTPRVDLIFDASASMFLTESKATRTWELVYFCMESALRVGASLKIHWLSGGTEVQSLNATTEIPLEQALAHDWPIAFDTEKSAIRNPKSAMSNYRAGSLRVLISDLLQDTAPELVVNSLQHGRGRALILVPFCNEEAHPDWSGNIEFEDCELNTSDRRRVEPDILQRYLRAYQLHFALWREQCSRRGIGMARVASEAEFLAALRVEAVLQGCVEM
jgi:uncharacterized protein (DUF58 family)